MDHVSANKSLTATERENISGCRVFDGEDQGKNLPLIFTKLTKINIISLNKRLIISNLGAGNRYRMQQLQQQDWCEQQIREKALKKDVSKQVDALFDAQTIQQNEALGISQSEHNRLRLQNELDTQKINGILAQEKKAADKQMHDNWVAQEKTEVAHWMNHDVLTENPAKE
jgi:hypothetical protein